MLKRLRRYLDFERHANLWDWLRAHYTDAELAGLAAHATDAPLIREWNPFDASTDSSSSEALERKEFMDALLKRYGGDIWMTCLRAGGYLQSMDHLGLACLARLDYATQVHDPNTFREFLIRNALKHAAREVLQDPQRTPRPTPGRA